MNGTRILAFLLVTACSSNGTQTTGNPPPVQSKEAAQKEGGRSEGGHAHGGPRYVGSVEFAVSCQDAVRPTFQRGVALLHHMMYEQAREQFLKTAEQDPKCAMAHWGMAMTMVQPLWPGKPTEDALKKGIDHVAKAKSLNPPTDREKGYVAAIEAFYTDWEKVPHEERLKRWEEKAKALHLAHPEDVDAKAFYALTVLNTAPKTDKTFANQRVAGQLLEEIFAANAEHPGAVHYMTHAYDNPMLAEKGIPASQAYDKIAQDVPHALHMPTHIFVRLGRWDDTIAWNIRSGDAALKRPVEGAVSHHYPHALDYMVYGYLQKAQDQKAKEVMSAGASHPKYQETFISAYGLAAMPARYALERHEWAEASAMSTRIPEVFGWDRVPWFEAIPYFAKGLGAARSGNVADAEKSIKMLDEAIKKSESAGEAYWVRQITSNRDTVKAWIALAKEKNADAVKLMRAAADLEDSVDKHPVTPGAVLPARELLGDMLLETKKPAEALEAYETALATTPNRFNSLHGAAKAAEMAKKPEKAKEYYMKLRDLTKKADSERPAIKEARTYLEEQK